MAQKLKLYLTLSVCLLAMSAMVAGQSGRKKKTERLPPIQGVNQPDARVEPAPQVAPEKPKEKEPERTIMVSSAMPDMMLPIFYGDIARDACLKELRGSLKSVTLREGGNNQTRSEAIKAAKDTGVYVVHMELQPDQFGGSSSSVDLRYTIFEPRTGKVAGSGSGYPNQPSGGILQAPPVGASRDQIYLDWMGRDVARQVMKRLNLVPLI
jgi:hypothetical protein